MLWCEWRTGQRMSGFRPDNRQISALQTGPGLVAKDPWLFRRHKRTVDLAVSSASSLKRGEGATVQNQKFFKMEPYCCC